VILDCYRLAREYKVDPQVFLNKPMSEIRRHMNWTTRLIESIEREQEWASRGG